MSNSYNFQRVRNDRQNLSQVNAETLNVSGNASVTGSLTADTITPAPEYTVSSGTYVEYTNAGDITIDSVADTLITGYTLNKSSGAGTVELKLPSGANLQAALASRGITSGNGLRLGSLISIYANAAGGNVSITNSTDNSGTVINGGAFTAVGANVYITFTGVAEYVAVVVKSSA